MTRGPAPKPQALAERQGTRPASGGSTPAVDNSLPISSTAPPFVQEDELALGVWEQLHLQLGRMGFVKASDSLSLGQYCLYFAQWLRLARTVREDGASYTTESQWGKYKRRNPDVMTWLALGEKLTQLGDRFGLSPAARQRIQLQMAGSGLLPADPDARDVPGKAGDAAGDTPVGLFAPRGKSEVMN